MSQAEPEYDDSALKVAWAGTHEQRVAGILGIFDTLIQRAVHETKLRNAQPIADPLKDQRLWAWALELELTLGADFFMSDSPVTMRAITWQWRTAVGDWLADGLCRLYPEIALTSEWLDPGVTFAPWPLAELSAWIRRGRSLMHDLSALHEMIGNELRSAGEHPDPGSNGLRPGNVVVHSGRSCVLTPRQFQLMEQMWKRASMPMDDMMQAIWGNERVSEGTLRSLVSDTSNAILAAKFPFELSVKSGYVIKSERLL